MESNDFINKIVEKLEQNKNLILKYTINGIIYSVNFLFDSNKVRLPSILLIPQSTNINNQIVMEVNNK